MLKIFAVSDLKPGMLVTQVLSQAGPVKIRKVGMIRSLDMVKGLTEMGVTQVEVDIAQSLNIDDDELDTAAMSGAIRTQSNDTHDQETSTQTQKLVASDKQIADVDRHLSQQFHRSLFLPAVEQMPSKWALYGKPYVRLLLVVTIGICLGWGASYGAFLAFTSPANDNIVAQNSESTDSLEAPISLLGKDEGVIQSKQQGPTKVQTATEQTDAQAPINDIVDLSDNRETSSEPSPVLKTEKIEQKVNGVVLEEGQQVLGYQGNDPIVYDSPDNDNQAMSDNTQSRNAESVNNQDTINPELYRRIQEAAKAVEEEPRSENQSIINVTDLNDLPRIDQLSPATLTQLPAMSFSAHMYASNPQDRWVRVNSRRLGEGDYISDNLQLKKIESEKVVLSFNGQDFTMNALSDW